MPKITGLIRGRGDHHGIRFWHRTGNGLEELVVPGKSAEPACSSRALDDRNSPVPRPHRGVDLDLLTFKRMGMPPFGGDSQNGLVAAFLAVDQRGLLQQSGPDGGIVAVPCADSAVRLQLLDTCSNWKWRIWSTIRFPATAVFHASRPSSNCSARAFPVSVPDRWAALRFYFGDFLVGVTIDRCDLRSDFLFHSVKLGVRP